MVGRSFAGAGAPRRASFPCRGAGDVVGRAPDASPGNFGFSCHFRYIGHDFDSVKICLDGRCRALYSNIYDVKIKAWERAMQQQATTEAAPINRAPIPMECDAPFLKVVGELPRELNGTLYRNGPNPQFDAPGAHWFVGDGMLHAFHLENGRASYRNRWIRTPKWQAEHDAGRALFGGFGRKLPGAPEAVPGSTRTGEASPTPTSSFTADACWHWKKAICRPRSSRAP